MRFLDITFIRPILQCFFHMAPPSICINLPHWINPKASSTNYSCFPSISAVKSSLELPDLPTRRLSSRLSLFHEVDYTPSPHQSFFLSISYTSQRTGHACKIGLHWCSFTAHSELFLPRGIFTWNYLPRDVVTTTCPARYPDAIWEYLPGAHYPL